MIEAKILAAIIGELARQEVLDDVDRFRQPLLALAPAGPAGADDVLVESLARTEPERETIVAEQRHRGGALRDHRGMVAHGRAGHRRHQADAPRRIGERAQHRPGERGVALLLEPGREVIGQRGNVEAGLLGALRVAHQRGRPVLFRHELVAELEHRGFPFAAGSRISNAPGRGRFATL